MRRYIKNGIAYGKGMIISCISKLYHERRISPNIRVFFSASLEFDKGSDLIVEKGVKIRERTFVTVRKGGNLTLGQNVSIGMDCKIVVHDNLVIGEGTLLSPNVQVYDHDHRFDSKTGVHRKEFRCEPIAIGKNCWIGANTIILKGTVIGDNSVVGAGSVIKGMFPDNSLILQKRETVFSELLK